MKEQAYILFKKTVNIFRGRLAGSAMGSFGIRIATTGLSFLISILLARTLGAKNYGAYAYAIAWSNLLAITSVLGLDRLLVRNIAVFHTQSSWGLMRGLLRRSNQSVVFASSGLALLAALVSLVFSTHFESKQMQLALLTALILLPLMAITRLRQAAMQGLKYTVISQLPEMLIKPLLFLALIGGIHMLFKGTLTAPRAVWLNVSVTGIACIIGTIFLRKILPSTVKETIPVYQTKTWFRSALPLLFVSSMLIINAQTDVIMLGAIKGARLAGIYAVANRGAELITFVLLAVNTVLSPTVASLYSAGNKKQLQRVVTKSARMVLLFSSLIAFGMIIFGHWYLSLFGQDFPQGRTALTILSSGQIVNAAMGSVGMLLIMTGHERYAATGIGISAAFNVFLNALLIPPFGMEGAAIATTSSMVIWNLILAIFVYRKPGIDPTALGRVVSQKVVHEALKPLENQ